MEVKPILRLKNCILSFHSNGYGTFADSEALKADARKLGYEITEAVFQKWKLIFD